MGRQDMPRDAITYSATISALAKGKQWHAALQVFEHMQVGARGRWLAAAGAGQTLSAVIQPDSSIRCRHAGVRTPRSPPTTHTPAPPPAPTASPPPSPPPCRPTASRRTSSPAALSSTHWSAAGSGSWRSGSSSKCAQCRWGAQVRGWACGWGMKEGGKRGRASACAPQGACCCAHARGQRCSHLSFSHALLLLPLLPLLLPACMLSSLLHVLCRMTSRLT